MCGFREVKRIAVFEGISEGEVAMRSATSAAAKKGIQVMDNR